MLEKYEHLIPLPSNWNWRGNKAVFPHTLSSQLLILSRFSTHLYNYMLWHQSLSGLSATAPGTSLSSVQITGVCVESPKFLSSCRFTPQLCWQTLIWHLCVFIPASAACSIWPWQGKKSFFPLKYETAGRVWQPSCASEHLGCILTVLNIRGIDSGIRCTPSPPPRPARKSRDFQKWE